jgi:3,4-dihydroxy-2-butanone 4-phosphate synthase
VADVTVLVARVRDGNYEACVELAQMSGVTTVTELVEVISPSKQITPLTFELVCKALEFVTTYPIKEKQS